MLSGDLGLIVGAFRPQFGSYRQDYEGYAIACSIADVSPFRSKSALYENAPSEFGDTVVCCLM